MASGLRLTARVLSALVLAPPVLAAILLGRPYFDLLVAAAAILVAWEWSRMCRPRGEGGKPPPAGARRALWLAAGIAYVGVPTAALLWLRTGLDAGREVVLWLFLVVWATDIGAYAFGSTLGGPRVAPAISPHKTWAGIFGGIACAGGAGALVTVAFGKPGVLPVALLSAVVGLVAEGGDLLESWIKRHFGVKDASRLIPGHGGVMDRTDGLFAAAVATALIGLAGKGNILPWT